MHAPSHLKWNIKNWFKGFSIVFFRSLNLFDPLWSKKYHLLCEEFQKILEDGRNVIQLPIHKSWRKDFQRITSKIQRWFRYTKLHLTLRPAVALSSCTFRCDMSNRRGNWGQLKWIWDTQNWGHFRTSLPAVLCWRRKNASISNNYSCIVTWWYSYFTI